ncbi:unnamed protein product, partial [marine sediment metagenome]
EKQDSKKQDPESKEEKEFDDLIKAVVLYKAGELEEEELNEKTKKLVKFLSTAELCPRCSHWICLKNGKCPNCGLVKKGDEWEAFKGKEIEGKKKEKKKEEEKLIGTVFDDVLTFDKEEKSEEE